MKYKIIKGRPRYITVNVRGKKRKYKKSLYTGSTSLRGAKRQCEIIRHNGHNCQIFVEHSYFASYSKSYTKLYSVYYDEKPRKW